MQIQAIQTKLTNQKFHTNTIKQEKPQTFISETNLEPCPLQTMQSYFINFKGKSDEEEYDFSQDAEKILSDASNFAKEMNNKEINAYHVFHAIIEKTLDDIKTIESGDMSIEDFPSSSTLYYLINIFSPEIFTDTNYRNKFKDILINTQKQISSLVKSNKPIPKKTEPEISYEYFNDTLQIKANTNNQVDNLTEYDLLNGIFASNIREIDNFSRKFSFEVNDFLQINKKTSQILYFNNYDKKAEKVIKDLSLETNVFVTYDDKMVNPNYFVTNIAKALENSEQKLNKENSKIIEFNDNITLEFLSEKTKKLGKNEDKQYIVIIPENELINQLQGTNENEEVANFVQTYISILKNPPKNVHFVILDSKNNFTTTNLSILLSDFGEITIPILDQDDMKNAMKHNGKELFNELGFSFSKSALNKIIEISPQINGKYPDKVIDLLHKISSQNPDKDVISASDVNNYIKEANYLFNSNQNDDNIEILFNTGKTLKDILGRPNTKKDAENIVNQIKNKKIGTKGYIIYNEDGIPGGGRRFIAEAIAGEAKIPFVSMDTVDFTQISESEKERPTNVAGNLIKNAFSTVKTQAESNKNKSAMLYINNFEKLVQSENVFSGDYYSKLLAILTKEIKQAEKDGLNIIVMGAVSDLNYLYDSITTSRFNNTLSVESLTSPSQAESRYDVLKYYFKKYNIKIEGDINKQEELLKSISKTLSYFPFMQLETFVKKANEIALERHHKAVTKADLTESYIRTLYGRASTESHSPFEDEIVAKHECGHAVTGQIMNNLMKNHGKEWCIPRTINFLTLDARSDFGGFTQYKNDNNSNITFETVFSNIIGAYGGHSAEKLFFDMDGTWGISGDLEHVTNSANLMVRSMGQGYNTGKISVGDNEMISPQLLSKIETDINVITRNALKASDLIVENYAGYIQEFSDKYASLAGTGDCLIDGDVFRKELNDWIERQPKLKREDLKIVDDILLDIINYTKKGKIY